MLSLFAATNSYMLTQPPAVALAAPARAVAPQMGVRHATASANPSARFRHQLAWQPNFRDARSLMLHASSLPHTCAQHAQICKVEGANIHGHDTVRDGIIPALKRHVTSVKTEQFIYELSQLDENTGSTNEARMDIIAEMPQLRAMLDIRVFLSTLVGGWKSTRAHEMEKHNRYVTHRDGRRCTNMKLYAAVVNTYGKVGQEFVDFCSVVDNSSRGKARGRDLTILLSLLGVYANAEKVVLAHAPALKRAQRGDVIAAMAAKDAQQAATAANGANAAAKALRENATPQEHPKSAKRPDLRGNITSRDGKQWIFCKGCKKETSYAGWSTHCLIHHSKVNGKVNAHVGDKKDDDRSRSKPRPKAKAGAKKTGGLKNGPAEKKKTSPRGS